MKRILELLNNGMLKNGVLSIIATFFIKGINLISIPIFTRILSTEEYGETNLFMTYASIFTILVSVSLVGCVSRGIVEYYEKKKQFLSSVLFLSLIIFAIVFSLIFGFRGIIIELLEIKLDLLLILIFYSYANFVLNYVSSSFIIDYKYKENLLISGGTAIINVVLSIVFILTVFNNEKSFGRIAGAAIPTILVALVLVFVILYTGKQLVNIKYWKFALQISVPLIPHNLSHLIFNQSDKIMIAAFVNSSAVGIYSLVTNLSFILMTLVEALNNVWIPWLYRKMKEDSLEEMRIKAKRYFNLFTVITIAFMIVSPEIIKILGPETYWEGMDVVCAVIVGVFFYFLYTLYANIEFYLKKTTIISAGTMMAAVVNVGINLLFMSRYGYKVAAYSTLLSYFALFLVHYFIVTKIFKIYVCNKTLLLANTFVVCITGMYIQFFCDSFILRLLGGGIVMSVLIIRIIRKTREKSIL